ncbi:YlmH family RNA-binding protein [Enterococcus camelliae]|uniref:RNA-binding protein n=1 Tax=Enterococcus camelliae TaxID=453959 RepID=A0ABW5TKP6_9ENTE
MDANIYQHFRNDERPFIDAVQDWIEKVQMQYAPYLTDFLDPRQAFILETIVRQQSDLQFQFYGGYEQAERTRCLIYPDYYTPVQDEFDIILFEIKYPEKFTQLSHGKILGTLVHSGMKREFFGDIISDGQQWQVFVAKEVQNYVQLQVTKMGSVHIRLIEKNYTEVLSPKDAWLEEATTVSSMRLDTVIASVFSISRQRSKLLIETGKVKVNWRVAERPDFMLELLDIVSIRGFGRLQIQKQGGTTKKEKIRLAIGVLRK